MKWVQVDGAIRLLGARRKPWRDRNNGRAVKESIYLALAISLEGKTELLGLWIDQREGAKSWLGIISELKNRGVQDILIAAVDGLSAFPDAIRGVYPTTEIEPCLLHVVRSCLRFVPYKDRRTGAAGLKTICSAPTEEAALAALREFRASCDEKYPMTGRSWHERWTDLVNRFNPCDASVQVESLKTFLQFALCLSPGMMYC